MKAVINDSVASHRAAQARERARASAFIAAPCGRLRVILRGAAGACCQCPDPGAARHFLQRASPAALHGRGNAATSGGAADPGVPLAARGARLLAAELVGVTALVRCPSAQAGDFLLA